MSGAKGKYNEANVQKCLDAIALYGTDRAGYESIPIAKQTFYSWLSDERKTDFSDGVAKARQFWQESQGSKAKIQAWEVLKRYLFEGQVEHWTVVKDAFDRDGRLIQLTETRTVRRGVPRWVLERYLGKPIHELEALQAIAPWLPQWALDLASNEINSSTQTIRKAITGALPDRSGSVGSAGLTDETARAIRAKILGVDAADPASVSSQVGSGPVPSEGNSEVTPDRDQLG